jgi:hypothetical protein
MCTPFNKQQRHKNIDKEVSCQLHIVDMHRMNNPDIFQIEDIRQELPECNQV